MLIYARLVILFIEDSPLHLIFEFDSFWPLLLLFLQFLFKE